MRKPYDFKGNIFYVDWRVLKPNIWILITFMWTEGKSENKTKFSIINHFFNN